MENDNFFSNFKMSSEKTKSLSEKSVLKMLMNFLYVALNKNNEDFLKAFFQNK